MRGDNRLVCIVLNKRPNGRSMKHPKPMRIKRLDADRLVDTGRANFIAKSIYREMVAAIPQKPEKQVQTKHIEKRSKKRRGWRKKKYREKTA